MIINTNLFGQIEIDESSIIVFDEGIPGFEEIKKYAIINNPEGNSPFKWLQAVEFESPAFVIINPFEIKQDYDIEIDDSTGNSLEIKEPSEVVIYSIVVIPEDATKMSTNLKAPIVINASNNKAKQMILDNSPYMIKHYILDELSKNILSVGGGK